MDVWRSMTTRFREPLYERLRRAAFLTHRRQSEIVNEALTDWLDKFERNTEVKRVEGGR